ncbi:MAG: hypothetical protein ACTFAL_10355 [Candidatus Electronema sp. V4]|uniref:hypothetical protein n=1 Tax=Candidatus Electronema sp. V4 TaxID=3454756 RepID=UPI00405586BF
MEKEWLRRKIGGLGKGIFWKKRARFRVQNRHRLIRIRRFQGGKKAASYLKQEFPFSEKGAAFSEKLASKRPLPTKPFLRKLLFLAKKKLF